MVSCGIHVVYDRAGFWKHGNEPFHSVIGGEFLDKLNILSSSQEGLTLLGGVGSLVG